MARNTGFRASNVHVRGNRSGNAGAEIDSFLKIWARTNVTGTGKVPVNASFRFGANQEELDLGGASSVTSTANLLPANSVILAVVTHVTVDLSTPVNIDVGDTTTATRFGTNVAIDQVSDGPIVNLDHWAGTVAIRQASAAKLKLRPDAAGTGKVMCQVFYAQFAGGLA